MSFWCYTNDLDEAARVIAARTGHLGVRFKVEMTGTGTYTWEHEFHIETARKDLGKEDITVEQARMYIKDKMFEENLRVPVKLKHITKDQINDYVARNYPWVEIKQPMNKDEMAKVALVEMNRE